jgi:hypothetical protein
MRQKSEPPHSVVLLLLCVLCVLRGESVFAGAEVRGVSLASVPRGGVGYGSDACREQLKLIAATGANWVAINDYAWMEAIDRPAVRYGRDGRSPEGDIAQTVRDAHAVGLKVVLKPHLWSRDFGRAGKWHGDIRMTTEADWDQWFAEYGEYVLTNARIAAETKAEAMCVGVEYVGTVDQAARWRKLVADVRAVYTGYVTYAASFLEWDKVTWWDALDCIGIDAYFPLASQPNATDEELRAGWAKVYAQILPFAARLDKPICFLELGYSDSAKAGMEPWAYDIVDPNPEYQACLYRVALEEAAKHDQVVGVFVWKWFTAEPRDGRRRDPFLVQDRPLVRDVLSRAWGGRSHTTMPAATAATTHP